MVTRNAILPVLFAEEYPKTAIDVTIEILQADASTRCAGINAAVLALADAGIPMKGLVSSASAGRAQGKIILDVVGKEDTEGEVDLPVAYDHNAKQVTLLQLDGITPPQEVKDIVALGIKGCEQVREVQEKALRDRYKERSKE